MERLFNALFSNLEQDEYIELRVLRQGTDSAAPFLCDSIKRTLQVCKDATDVYNVWFGVAPRYKSTNVVRRLTALWLDIDANDYGNSLQEALRHATEYIVFNPSCLVQSGNGYHAYWFLESPTNPKAAARVLNAMHQKAAAGPTHDVTRFLRVPGTMNPKYNPPRPCEIIYINTDIRYLAEDLLASTQLEDEIMRRIVTGDTDGYPSRSERDWHVIRALQIAGVSYNGITTLFQTRPIGDKYQAEQNKAHYLQRTIDRAAESLQGISIKMSKTENGEEQVKIVQTAFVEKDDGYYLKGKRISTFIYLPTRLLRTLDGDVFSGTMKSGEQEWENVVLPKSAFDKTHSLLKHLTIAHWQWLGTDGQVRELLPYILKRFDELGGTYATATSAVGRHGEHWVTESGVITRDGFIPNAVSPIVFIDQQRKYPSQVNPEEIADAEDMKSVAEQFAHLYPKLNKAEVAMVMLSWFSACLIKPAIEEAGYRMPNLSVWGTRGSGKTTMIQLLSTLIGMTDPNSVNARTTPFVLLSMLASSTSLPIHLGEFRMDMSDAQLKSLRTWLLMQYDSGTDARGRPDQSVVEYQLSAPMVLDGEDMFDDPAVKERTIAVNMSPEEISEGTDGWAAFLELSEYDVQIMSLPLIRFSLGYDAAWAKRRTDDFLQQTYVMYPTRLPNRVRKNIAVCMTGWKLFQDFMLSIGIDFMPPAASVFADAIGDVVNPITGRTSTHVDEFIVDAVNQAAKGKEDFRWKYDPTTNILWLHLATAVGWWYQYRRRTGQPVLGTAAIKRQLRERSAIEYPGIGQYIMDIKTVYMGTTSMHAYGVSLGAMAEAGMDVPNRLDVGEVVIKLGPRKERVHAEDSQN